MEETDERVTDPLERSRHLPKEEPHRHTESESQQDLSRKAHFGPFLIRHVVPFSAGAVVEKMMDRDGFLLASHIIP